MREVVKIEKKGRILDAAALLFSRRQYHEVMIEDVAKLASIAKGTVYNYFSSKEEIYFSIMLERMDTLINSLAQKIKSTDDRAALESYVVHLYMFMMKYQDFFLMYRKETLKAENQLCSTIAKMHRQLKEMLKQIINSGIERKVFRDMNAGFAADLIIGSIYAAVDRGIEKNYSDKNMIKERGETFNFIYEGMSSRKEELPLAGKRIILTRTEEQNKESAPLFESAGAEVISLPMIKIEETFDKEKFEEYISADPDFLVFMSANAVRIFSDNLFRSGKALKENIKIAAVGYKTADECRARGFNVDIIPAKQSAEGLMESFNKNELAGKRFLIPRSAVGRMQNTRTGC
jgi:AcrR family transcriptional regulator